MEGRLAAVTRKASAPVLIGRGGHALPLNGDRRRHRRQKSVIPFAYCIPLGPPGICLGITADISDSGMCVYSDSIHDKGEIIEVRSSLPMGHPRAMVKWGRKDAANLFKMGLMFIE